MHNSDDDVVVIDSTTASDSPAPEEDEEYSFSRSSAAYSEGEAQESVAQQLHPRSRNESGRVTAHDAQCERMQAALQAVSSSARGEAEVQTEAVAIADGADEVTHRLHALTAALGIDRAVFGKPTAAAHQQEQRGVVERLVVSWREAARGAKRPRCEPATDTAAPAEDDVNAGETHVKRERVSTAASSDPAWWPPLQAALAETQRLLLTSAAGKCGRRDGGQDADAARRALLTAATPSPAPPAAMPHPLPGFDATGQRHTSGAGASVSAAPPPPPSALAATAEQAVSASPLLREAEVMCAREGTASLRPLFVELHTLRRQHAETQQAEAQRVAQQLQWEQRLLLGELAECEAQLEALEGNFMDACRGGLVPLDALQQRMERLQSLRRQVRSAAAATAPQSSSLLPSAHAGSTGASLSAAVDGGRLPRVVGRVGEAVADHLEAERRALAAQVTTLQAALAAQQRETAELQTRYAHATAQVQQNLDAAAYVSRDAITALRRQHGEEAAALARQFGWTLLKATPDVLSLRHPRSAEVLHVNHAYGTINGRPCGDVAQSLADYLLKHAGPAAAPTAAAAVAPQPPAPAPTAPAVVEEEKMPPLSSTGADEEGEDEKGGGDGDAVPTPAPAPAAEAVQPDCAEGPGSVSADDIATSVPSVHEEMREGEDEEEDAAVSSAHTSPERAASLAEPSAGQLSGGGSGADHEADEQEEGEEEDEEEALVDYSHVRSDDTAASRMEQSGTTEDAEGRQTPPAPPPQLAVADEPQPPTQEPQPPADVYTGFFAEGALWDEDS